MKNNTPTEKGLYWVIGGAAKYWQLADVFGEVPFLRVRLHDEIRDTFRIVDPIFDIKEWGPKVERPS